MTTLISSTNVGLSELETAPGGANPPSDLSFDTSGRRGWNVGSYGSGTFNFYTWGYGNGSSGYLDAIYGLNTPTTGSSPPLTLGDWRGLQYWFDGTTFDIKTKYQNNLVNIPDDDISVDVLIADSSLNYLINGAPFGYMFNVNMPASTSQGATQIPGFMADVYVLVKRVFWGIQINTGPFFNGGTFTLGINGTNVFTQALNPGPNNIQYDFSNGSSGLTGASGIELDLQIN